MTRRLVVIGNGMAATRLVQRLVERDPARFAITVVGDEPHPAYNRIQLSPLLAGEKTAAQIPLLPAEWYTRHGVCLRSGEAVDEVDIQQRRLRIAETWLPWDELVFATGSRPFIPPLPGIDRPQVMPFRTLADVERILAIPGPAVVIGGGVLGVEAAAALRRHGGEVTLLHRGSGLMAPLTDAFAADELRQQLEARGIRCVLACRIAAIDADGVRLADGRVFRAARVVLATGVQPDSRLAAQSGVLCQRGIVVDRQMASSLPGISAIGECCEIDGQTWGLVAPCLRQAEVLAEVEKSYVYTQPLHVEPVLPQAVSKSYYKLYLPWGELSLYAQLDVPENASQRVLRRPAAPFGFHLPALVEETQVRQAAAVPFDLTPGLAEDIARSRILDAIRAEFGDYELLEETPSAEEADGAVTLTLRVRMLADIGKMVPYEGEAMEPDSTIGADS